MGHRTASGWVIDVQSPLQITPDTYYQVLLAVNGTTATVSVDGASAFTLHLRAAGDRRPGVRPEQGPGGRRLTTARRSFDNIAVQVLPPQITLDSTEDFSDGVANHYTGPSAGTWTVTPDGRYSGTPATGVPAYKIVDLGIGHGLDLSSYLELQGTMSSTGMGGFVFDWYAPNDFKFAALDVPGQRVIVGHNDPRRGWTVDSSTPWALTAGTDYPVVLTLKGASVGVTVGGAYVTSFGFNAAVIDGSFGVLARTGGTQASFDSTRIRTNDPAFTAPPTPPMPAVSITGGSVTEGAAGTMKLAMFTLTLDRPAVGGETVAWATSNGSATAGSDYIATSGTVSFIAGQTNATISVTVLGDGTSEGDETFSGALSSGSGLTIAGGSATFTIGNDDAAPPPPAPASATLSVQDVQITEGDKGTTNFKATVTLSQAMTTAVTVVISTASAGTGAGYATAGSDYKTNTTTLTFNPGVTSLTFTMTMVNDRAMEGDEVFSIVLSSPSGATIADGTAVARIVDNDVALMAAAMGSGIGVEAVTVEQALPALAAAIGALVTAGADRRALGDVALRIGSLGGRQLAKVDGRTIVLDADAAGWGWHLDPATAVPAGRIDLLTVLVHELGHVFGLEHEAHGVMDDELAAGERRLPDAAPATARAYVVVSHAGLVASLSARHIHGAAQRRNSRARSHRHAPHRRASRRHVSRHRRSR